MSEVTNLYFLEGPDQWPSPPEMFSYSMLSTLETCILRWQLEKGIYGELDKFPQRPNQKTIAGQMTHEGLDKLFRALAIKNYPAIGSPDFQSVLMDLNLPTFFQQKIEEINAEILEHPRGAGFQLKITSQDLMNKTIGFFRQEYQPENKKTTKEANNLSSAKPKDRTQSELKLYHPELPFMGLIDLLKMTPEGAVIVDFKTGQVKPEHLDQVEYYALLWWRYSKVIPVRIEVRYPNLHKSKPINQSDLETLEKELKDKIEYYTYALETAPADATTGSHCEYCQVKQFCDKYWDERSQIQVSTQNAKRLFEGEVKITGQPTSYGFEISLADKSITHLVFEQDGEKLHGPFRKGATLRILNASTTESFDAIELKRWSEVYHLKSDSELQSLK